MWINNTAQINLAPKNASNRKVLLVCKPSTFCVDVAVVVVVVTVTFVKTNVPNTAATQKRLHDTTKRKSKTQDCRDNTIAVCFCHLSLLVFCLFLVNSLGQDGLCEDNLRITTRFARESETLCGKEELAVI